MATQTSEKSVPVMTRLPAGLDSRVNVQVERAGDTKSKFVARAVGVYTEWLEKSNLSVDSNFVEIAVRAYIKQIEQQNTPDPVLIQN
ncbi:MAG: hypothetical protein BroJett011_62350 [Chloroflexota bacterium]|nr:MAG: hypothetical protein BroJett011_62350 [Chloroflexota bacterium]